MTPEARYTPRRTEVPPGHDTHAARGRQRLQRKGVLVDEPQRPGHRKLRQRADAKAEEDSALDPGTRHPAAALVVGRAHPARVELREQVRDRPPRLVSVRGRVAEERVDPPRERVAQRLPAALFVSSR